MMSRWPSPAKLNLFLYITGQRADGYHTLQTLFQFLDYGDTLTIEPRTDGQLRLLTPVAGVPDEENLIVRAARLLMHAASESDRLPAGSGADISIDKRLPMGGGLGGGSADAATVLLALNHLWQLGLSRQRLQEIGLTLGADVPVFIFGQNAFAEGVGEALQPLDLPPAWYVVLETPVQIPTAAIFGVPELKRDTPAMHAADWRPGLGTNDLQPVAVARFPIVAEYLAWLSAYGDARMTGSGACVFAEFATERAAREVLARLPNSMRGWVAPGLDKHPLCGLAA